MVDRLECPVQAHNSAEQAAVSAFPVPDLQPEQVLGRENRAGIRLVRTYPARRAGAKDLAGREQERVHLVSRPC
jgi:hypothetical protein